nr:MAG TPA: hypothetical protein [Caudoviricetes sp.]
MRWLEVNRRRVVVTLQIYLIYIPFLIKISIKV